MADHTSIEWTDATWNPITGCSIVSPGCTNCYAMRLAGTRLKHIPSRAGLTIDSKAGPVWNGQVRLNEQWLDQPLRWKRPRRIFVCAHGDLFAERVPDEWIDRVFAVMALAAMGHVKQSFCSPICASHVFQVLTKRASRMSSYLSQERVLLSRRWADAAIAAGIYKKNGALSLDQRHSCWEFFEQLTSSDGCGWPLPHIWLGISAEDQRRADERVPELLATPAAIRFVSAEPLLGPIHFDDFCNGHKFIDALRGNRWHDDPDGPNPISRGHEKLDWMIVGGESGPDARPMHQDWVRSIRDQCAAAGTAFFFKQWGAHRPLTSAERGQACGATLIGSDPHDRNAYVLHVGKKAAGRLLDGVEHNAMPRVRVRP